SHAGTSGTARASTSGLGLVQKGWGRGYAPPVGSFRYLGLDRSSPR
ncbi:hypothetical protein Tco_0552596, partial [Tanacetum coccineum]